MLPVSNPKSSATIQSMAGSQKGYVAPPSIGHELGVLFGFVAIFILSLFIYVIIYRIRNKRMDRKEVERMRALKAQGVVPNEKAPYDAPADDTRY